MTPGPPITVFVWIGNKDDGLSAFRWRSYHTDVAAMMTRAGGEIRGEWFSGPVALWQTACWCVELQPGIAERLQEELAVLAGDYEQDSIIWAEAPLQFLG